MKENTQPPSYPLRLAPELRERLEGVAKGNKRSLNAEIAARLDASFSVERALKHAAPGASLEEAGNILVVAAQDRETAKLRLFENAIREHSDEIFARMVKTDERLDRLDSSVAQILDLLKNRPS
jgi:hypothetical protein